MTDQAAPLTLQMLSDPATADDEALLHAGAALSHELNDSALAERVEPLADGPTAAGSKSGELVTAGALLLAVLPTTVPALLDFLKAWLTRPGNSGLRIKLTDGERGLEVDGFDPATMDEAAMLALVDKLRRRVQSGDLRRESSVIVPKSEDRSGNQGG